MCFYLSLYGLCFSSRLCFSVRWCVRTCLLRPCTTFYTTPNTERNGTRTSSRPSTLGDLRSTRMLVTTHVRRTLVCERASVKGACSRLSLTRFVKRSRVFLTGFLFGWRTGSCPKPLRNRDVITLRSWLPIGKDYIIMNYSVKHAVSGDTHPHTHSCHVYTCSAGVHSFIRRSMMMMMMTHIVCSYIYSFVVFLLFCFDKMDFFFFL